MISHDDKTLMDEAGRFRETARARTRFRSARLYYQGICDDEWASKNKVATAKAEYDRARELLQRETATARAKAGFRSHPDELVGFDEMSAVNLSDVRPAPQNAPKPPKE